MTSQWTQQHLPTAELASIVEFEREPTRPTERVRAIGRRVRGVTPLTTKKTTMLPKNRQRGVTPGTALRLSRLFGTTPEFWLNRQRNWDLWHALHSDEASDLETIEPVTAR